MQSSVSAPLEYSAGANPRPHSDDVNELVRHESITLQFSLSRDIASAGQDVQAAINAATGWLPVNALPAPPIYRKVNPADMPVLVLALTSETMSLHEITEYAATAFVPKLSQIEGVGESASRAARRARYACRPIRGNSPHWVCRCLTFARQSSQRPSTYRRGRLTARSKPSKSATTTSSSTPKIFLIRSLLIGTARRSCSRISARLSRGSRTRSLQVGTMASPPLS